MGKGRPLGRLGIVLRDLLPPAGPRDLLPSRSLVDLASLADRLGYESVWFPEGTGRELMSLLGAAAGATSRIRLATGILTIFSRPPALAAMAASTLADLTGGRFILGLGVGHPHIIEAGFGMRYRQPLAAIREYVEIVRRALAGEPVAYRGRVFQVEAFQLESAARHTVPIHIAALGEQMLRLSGEIADGVVLNWSTPERVRWAAEVVRGAARRAGRDPSSVTIVCYVRATAGPPSEAMRVARRLLATYSAMPAYARMFEAAGFSGDVAAVNAAWRTGGVDTAAQALSETFVRQMAVIITDGSSRAAFEPYYGAGADLVVAYPFPVGADAGASMRATIEALAPGRRP